MDEIELRLRKSIGAQVDPSDLDRVGRELLDEAGVDVEFDEQRLAAGSHRDSIADNRSRSWAKPWSNA